ncbi:MAG: tRNA (adenosine(37)-N6)-threonylcarbamoyltransferase complex dimerization subunit type 1 TsaB [Acidobacteriaceae bacterium]|nr:tRNA (adenosine(37)-N6)-threonylcarbamoyltransferase complex dimerization subunit type 1 TsaB [Acidobacteriaceae bacterium]
MKILLIDTCGATGSIALAETERSPALLASACLPGRTASERLVATIKGLTASNEISLQSLDVIAVVHGPGSFTGVRVGLSAAKGLCEALGLPLIAVSRLAVLASRAEPLHTAAPVYALLDAGRGEFYCGLYADGLCRSEALLSREEFLAEFNSAAAQLVVCEPSIAVALVALAPQLVADPTVEDALPLVLRRLEQRAFDEVATIDANYLRRTDAEIFAKPKPRSDASTSSVAISQATATLPESVVR